jgi:chromosome segregation ATPase
LHEKDALLSTIQAEHQREVQFLKESIRHLQQQAPLQRRPSSVDVEKDELVKKISSLEDLVGELKKAGQETLRLYESSLTLHEKEKQELQTKLDSSERRVNSLKRISGIDEESGSTAESASANDQLRDEYERILFDYAELKRQTDKNQNWMKELEKSCKEAEAKAAEKDKMAQTLEAELREIKEAGNQAVELYETLKKESTTQLKVKDEVIGKMTAELMQVRLKYEAEMSQVKKLKSLAESQKQRIREIDETLGASSLTQPHTPGDKDTRIRVLEASLQQKSQFLEDMGKAVSKHEEVTVLRKELAQLSRKVLMLEEVTFALESECEQLQKAKG